ncbi:MULTISPECIES: nitrate reductase molybdenum cofactor assembly chaperone [Phenylobacterium]|uniref:Nitrate reductase delta subunit n=1 Tax=Phenylobacterium koreense TaxID=266125 RepID=A0ABV2ENQ5_9CAUL
MSLTFRALAALIAYPTEQTRELLPEVTQVLEQDLRIPAPIRGALKKLAGEIGAGDLFDAQEAYVWLFDRTRSLSLNLYEHVHGESRDRGQAMVDLLELYRTHGLELSANELPDHLPVFLEFLSTLSDEEEALSLLGEAGHVLHVLGERLHRRSSSYRAVFGALAALAAAEADSAILAAMLAEPDDDPNDLVTMDRLWAENPVNFGPGDSGCPEVSGLDRGRAAIQAPSGAAA